MIPYAKENDGFKYLLTVIDCFSKYAWVEKLKTKSGKETADALENIFFRGRKPKRMQTDNGKEYYNSQMNKLLKVLKLIIFQLIQIRKHPLLRDLIGL